MIKQCEICGKDFDCKPSQAWRRHHCSNPCRYKSFKGYKFKKGEKKPAIRKKYDPSTKT